MRSCFWFQTVPSFPLVTADSRYYTESCDSTALTHTLIQTHTHSRLSQCPEGPQPRWQRQMAELVLIVSSCCDAHAFVSKVVRITDAGPDEKLLLITGQIQLLVNSCKVMVLPCG